MIDIHAHILPGLDDGARDLEIALQMARAAVADNIRQMIVTPHVISEAFPNRREQILQAMHHLQQEMQQQRIPLELFPGGEYRLEADLPKKLQNGEILSLNDGGQYLLIELPNSVLPPFFEQVLYDIQLQGVTPIIAHPERNLVIMEDPRILKKLTDRGMLVQITAASLVGNFGKDVKKSAWQLTKQGSAHFIASDTHYHSGRRSPLLSEAYNEIKKKLGEQMAQILLIENPGRVINRLGLNKMPELSPRLNWSQKLKNLGRH